MVVVESLCKTYRSSEVLSSVSFCLAEGRITGLAGPNACGKTTLIKCILGLVMPSSGSIQVGDCEIGQAGYRENIGYMPQNSDFPPNLSPREMFRLLVALRRQQAKRQEELVERFALGDFLKKPMGTLSAGTRQKVSAVAALMFEAPVLILDEPTAGFDPLACVHFKELVLDAASRGSAVLLVSHIMPELDQLISELLFLLDGKLVFSGEVSKLNEQTQTRGVEAGIVKLLGRATDAGRRS